MAYVGFKKLEEKVAAGGARDPGAVAATIGRKKYGKEKLQKAAAQGKSLKGTAPVHSPAARAKALRSPPFGPLDHTTAIRG